MLEPCDGPYRNPWFLVSKKTSAYRMINPATMLNSVTVRDAMRNDFRLTLNNLPRTWQVGQPASRPHFSLIDLFSGYDNVRLCPESRDMTAAYPII